MAYKSIDGVFTVISISWKTKRRVVGGECAEKEFLHYLW